MCPFSTLRFVTPNPRRFLLPVYFLNSSSSFDSHTVLHSQHFPVTFFFGVFGLSVVFFAFSGRLCTFVLATIILFFFFLVFSVNFLRQCSGNNTPYRWIWWLSMLFSNCFVFSCSCVIFVSFFCFRHYR